MKVKFISLASGSSGNCYYLGTETYGILICLLYTSYFILFLLNDAIDLIFFCKAIKIFPIDVYKRQVATQVVINPTPVITCPATNAEVEVALLKMQIPPMIVMMAAK